MVPHQNLAKQFCCTSHKASTPNLKLCLVEAIHEHFLAEDCWGGV